MPFARTRAEREANGDPRRSIEERYASHEDYVRQVRCGTEAAQALLADGFLLEEDAVRYVDAFAKARNPLDEGVSLAPLALSNRMPVSAASPR